VRRCHLPPKLGQHQLHVCPPLPLPQHREVGRVHHAIVGHTAHLNLRDEADLGWPFGIAVAAEKLQRIYPAVVHGLQKYDVPTRDSC